MDFGEALKALKEGKKVARKGWNGYRAGMYIYLTDGRDIFDHEWIERSPAQATTITERMNGKVHICPHIDMVSAHGERVIGWLASQTDMLSDDWEVID
jgi:hypothetical protein